MRLAGNILLVLLMVIAHEAGHAIAMLHRKVEVKELGVGLPLGKLRLTWRPRFLPFPVVLTPFLLGAYVRPTDKGFEHMRSLSYKDQAVISAAGPIMNVIFSAVLLAGVTAVYTFVPGYDHKRTVIFALVSAAVAIGVFFARRTISVLMPVISVGIVAYLVHVFTSEPSGVGGPVVVAGAIAAATTSWLDVIMFGILMSLNLAILNSIPIPPLDGGHIVSAFLRTHKWHRADNVYTVVGTITVLGFFGYVIISDFF